MGIYFNGRYHNDVYSKGKYHRAGYHGHDLVFRKNYYDAGVTDTHLYMQFSDQRIMYSLLRWSTYAVVQPRHRYRVQLAMDNRFRIFCTNGAARLGQTPDNLAIDSLDTNSRESQHGAIRSLEVTAGDNEDRLYIYYWNSSGEMEYEDVRKTIKVFDLGTQ